MTKHKKQTDLGEVKIKPRTLVLSGLVMVIIFFIVTVALAYGTKTSVGIRLKGFYAKLAPAPAAIINYRHFVLSSELEKNLASVEKFYATQDFSKTGLRVDFSTPEGQKRLAIKKKDLLQKMIEDRAIEILASERKITVSGEQATKIVNEKLQEFGTAEEVKKNLADSYGWNLEDFKKQVVIPSLYKEQLTAYFNEHDANPTKTKALADKAKSELASGKDFAQVANLYSDGSSKGKGGELGWVKKAQLLPELQVALFSKEAFKNDTVVESSIGFHIVEIENKKKDGGEDVLQLRQIFVAKYAFADWLVEQMKKMSIILPLNEFRWKSSEGVIEFKDGALNEFERQARQQTKGDASIIF